MLELRGANMDDDQLLALMLYQLARLKDRVRA
jgi:hypothetical protein